MTIYIKGINRFPTDEFGVTALFGFRQKGASIVFFENIEQVPLNRNSLVITYIDETRQFFEQMGFKVREDMTFPVELRNQPHLWKRTIEFWPAGELEDSYVLAKEFGLHNPFFCKPANKLKGFQYGVIHNLEEFKAVVDTKLDVIVSEVVDFVSEYRCFIIHGKIVSCQHYNGNLHQYPDLSVVQEAINLYKSAPAGYSIDVGVLSTGETALVELNNGWSLGCYGCAPKLYTRLLAERWREILVQNPVDLSDALTEDKLVELGFVKHKRTISAADMWQGVPYWTHTDHPDKTIWGGVKDFYFNKNFDHLIITVNQLYSYLKHS
jgi:hypothetical protein